MCKYAVFVYEHRNKLTRGAMRLTPRSPHASARLQKSLHYDTCECGSDFGSRRHVDVAVACVETGEVSAGVVTISHFPPSVGDKTNSARRVHWLIRNSLGCQHIDGRETCGVGTIARHNETSALCVNMRYLCMRSITSLRVVPCD